MDALSDFIGSSSFWRILLFLHFLMAVALLVTVTLHSIATVMPLQQPAGNLPAHFVERIRSAPPTWYVMTIVILYVPTFLLGVWVYVKYCTYVRIPMELIVHWMTDVCFAFM